MWVRTPTRRRRRPGARLRKPATAALALVILLAGGCSGAAHRADPPRSTATPAPGTPTSSPATPAPSSTGSPPRDTVRTATAPQLVGLVRIVASIGTDGRGETSTGMVLSGDGQVVTNDHGVAGATKVVATVMTTGRTYTARVVAADPDHDVALLHLDGVSDLRTVRLARSDAVVRDAVTAVGDARGLRSAFTAATGHVVALGRTLVTPANDTTRAERLTGVLVSTCDVTTGESGGPTYDAGGRVVGMTTAAVRNRSGLFGVAIPVGTLRSVVDGLRRS